MTSFDFVTGCTGDVHEMVLDEVQEVFAFVIEPKPVFDFQLCLDRNAIGNEYVFITEDGSLIFTTEDGEKFRPDNL